MNRPNRQLRRRLGKTDATDAQAAARAALNGQATGLPKSGDGPGRRHKNAASSSTFRYKSPHPGHKPVARPSGHRPRPGQTPPREPIRQSPRQSLCRLSSQHRPHHHHLHQENSPSLGPPISGAHTEIEELNTEMHHLCVRANPALLAAPGVGPDTASALLITAGDNPHRMQSEASFAALCGASPVQASPDRPYDTGSTAAATAKPTTRSGASHRFVCATTRPPSHTSKNARPKAKPAERSSAASKGTSPERSTTYSPTHHQHPTAPTYAPYAKKPRSTSPTPPKRSKPTPPSSHNSNEASDTTIN